MAKRSKVTFILTAGASLVAGEAHGSVELALGRFQRSQTLQDLLRISHRSSEGASPPIAIVVHYGHISFAHAPTYGEFKSQFKKKKVIVKLS